jgi:hypothetical protein
MARYKVPPVPGEWRGRETIRVVDPLGLSAAWIAPDRGGMPVGCYFRPAVDAPWLAAWETVGAGAGSSGCHLVLGGDGSEQAAIRARKAAPWRFVARDPTSVTVAGGIDEDLTITCTCDDGGLSIRLRYAAAPVHRPGPGCGFRLELERTWRASPCTASNKALIELVRARQHVMLRCTPSPNAICRAIPTTERHRVGYEFLTPATGDCEGVDLDAVELELTPDWGRARHTGTFDAPGTDASRPARYGT